MFRVVSHVMIWMLGFFVFVSCEKDEGVEKNEYDPNLPVVLDTFYPDSGRVAEKVIIHGSNFGYNKDLIKVYFNDKKGSVISSKGNMMYVVVPKMPGDECDVSVVIGNDSIVFDKKFYYSLSVSVSTVAGNGVPEFNQGVLSEATLRPHFLGVDHENNIFVSLRDADAYGIAMVNEEQNMVTPLTLGTSSLIVPNSPAIDRETGIITFPSEAAIPAFVTCDPKEAWAPRYRNFKIVETNGYNEPTNAWKHSMAACEVDGFVYTRFYEGQIIKINPLTYEAEIVFQTPNGTANGFTFHPLKPHMAYFAGRSGGIANGIYSFDINDPENTLKRLNAAGSGHRDGELDVALFRNPWQIYFDPEGYLYIADAGNHCIRRITPDNIVETVVGVPETKGWKDGGPEEALFNNPMGVGVDDDGNVYVADTDNNRIRKLAIE